MTERNNINGIGDRKKYELPLEVAKSKNVGSPATGFIRTTPKSRLCPRKLCQPFSVQKQPINLCHFTMLTLDFYS